MNRSLPSNRRGRILCVTSNFPRWEGDSATPFILTLVQDLKKMDWDVDVLAPHAPGAALNECIGGISVSRFRYCYPLSQQTICYKGGALVNLRQRKSNYLKVPAFVVAETASVLRSLSTKQYDLLHAHWILPQGFSCALAKTFSAVPLVVSAHGSDVFALRGRVYNSFKRFTLRRAEAVTVNSTATRNAVASISNKCGTVYQIPASPSQHPIDEETKQVLRLRFRGDRGPLVIFVGRLVEEKGVEDLLRAVSHVAAQLPEVRVLIVGEGPDRSKFEQLAVELALSDIVTFTGWVDPSLVATYLAAADVFVGPSRRGPSGGVEGQGLTFVESMLAGTPVVATPNGGITDFVRHEETGLLVEERNEHDIARAIIRVARDSRLAGSLKARAKQLALNEYSRDVVASSFSRLFDALLGNRAG